MCAARCRLCCEMLKAELASSRQACCNAARDFGTGTRQIPNLNEVQLPTPTFFHVFQVERHAKLGRPSVPGQGTLSRSLADLGTSTTATTAFTTFIPTSTFCASYSFLPFLPLPLSLLSSLLFDKLTFLT